MHVRTSLLLLVLVGGLLAVVLWQRDREENTTLVAERPLLEGVAAARVVSVRVDNLERGLQLAVERGEAGRWWITDPIEYPAEPAVVDLLIEILSTQTAVEVPGADPARLALDPPRAVIEFEEEISGNRVRRRVELGAVDLDKQYSYASVDGVVFRTPRTLDSMVERDLPGWRSNAVFFDLTPLSIVELRREGTVRFVGEPDAMDVGLELVRDDGWRATSPWLAGLDPGYVGGLIQALCFLRTQSYVDAPGNLSFYGLDEPAMKITVGCADGREEILRLAVSDNGEDWFAATESSPHVYTISYDDLVILATPVDVLVDRAFVRFARDGVERVELGRPEDNAVLARDVRSKGEWWLELGDGAAREPADAGRVDDLLSALERARVLAFLPDVEWPGEVASIEVGFAGRVLGGALGPPHVTADGGTGVLFRRKGDGLVSLVDTELVELAQADPSALRSRQLVQVEEIDVARIELTTGDQERTYVRDREGRWTREGTEVEAKTFAALVDQLLFVRADELFRTGAPQRSGRDPIRVRIVRHDGLTDYVVEATEVSGPNQAGEAPEPRGLFTDAAGRQAGVAVDLHAALAELLGS